LDKIHKVNNEKYHVEWVNRVLELKRLLWILRIWNKMFMYWFKNKSMKMKENKKKQRNAYNYQIIKSESNVLGYKLRKFDVICLNLILKICESGKYDLINVKSTM